MTTTDAILITWDHKEAVPVDEVSAAAQRGFINMYTVDDTFGDFYGIVASRKTLEGDEVQETFERIEQEWMDEPVVQTKPQEYRTIKLEIEILAEQKPRVITTELKRVMGVLEDMLLDIYEWRITTSENYGKVEA